MQKHSSSNTQIKPRPGLKYQVVGAVARTCGRTIRSLKKMAQIFKEELFEENTTCALNNAKKSTKPRATEADDALKKQSSFSFYDCAGVVKVRTSAQILQEHRLIIVRILELLPLEEAEATDVIWPFIKSFADYIGDLPASECYHHYEPSGLMRHSLETALLALQYAMDLTADIRLTPKERRENLRSFLLLAFAGGLLHDAGKVLTDLTVSIAYEAPTYSDKTVGSTQSDDALNLGKSNQEKKLASKNKLNPDNRLNEETRSNQAHNLHVANNLAPNSRVHALNMAENLGANAQKTQALAPNLKPNEALNTRLNQSANSCFESSFESSVNETVDPGSPKNNEFNQGTRFETSPEASSAYSKDLAKAWEKSQEPGAFKAKGTAGATSSSESFRANTSEDEAFWGSVQPKAIYNFGDELTPGRMVWNPVACSLTEFLQHYQAPKYGFHYRAGRGKSHETLAQIMACRIIPENFMHLILKDTAGVCELFTALTGQEKGRLYNLIKKADIGSVLADLGSRRFGSLVPGRLPGALERFILIIQDRLRRFSELINSPEGILFIVGQEVYLSLNTHVYLELLRPLIKAGLAPSFRDKTAFMEALINRGIGAYRNPGVKIVVSSFIATIGNTLYLKHGCLIERPEYFLGDAVRPAPLPLVHPEIYRAFTILYGKSKLRLPDPNSIPAGVLSNDGARANLKGSVNANGIPNEAPTEALAKEATSSHANPNSLFSEEFVNVTPSEPKTRAQRNLASAQEPHNLNTSASMASPQSEQELPPPSASLTEDEDEVGCITIAACLKLLAGEGIFLEGAFAPNSVPETQTTWDEQGKESDQAQTQAQAETKDKTSAQAQEATQVQTKTNNGLNDVPNDELYGGPNVISHTTTNDISNDLSKGTANDICAPSNDINELANDKANGGLDLKSSVEEAAAHLLTSMAVIDDVGTKTNEREVTAPTPQVKAWVDQLNPAAFNSVKASYAFGGPNQTFTQTSNVGAPCMSVTCVSPPGVSSPWIGVAWARADLSSQPITHVITPTYDFNHSKPAAKVAVNFLGQAINKEGNYGHNTCSYGTFSHYGVTFGGAGAYNLEALEAPKLAFVKLHTIDMPKKEAGAYVPSSLDEKTAQETLKEAPSMHDDLVINSKPKPQDITLNASLMSTDKTILKPSSKIKPQGVNQLKPNQLKPNQLNENQLKLNQANKNQPNQSEQAKSTFKNSGPKNENAEKALFIDAFTSLFLDLEALNQGSQAANLGAEDLKEASNSNPKSSWPKEFFALPCHMGGIKELGTTNLAQNRKALFTEKPRRRSKVKVEPTGIFALKPTPRHLTKISASMDNETNNDAQKETELENGTLLDSSMSLDESLANTLLGESFTQDLNAEALDLKSVKTLASPKKRGRRPKAKTVKEIDSSSALEDGAPAAKPRKSTKTSAKETVAKANTTTKNLALNPENEESLPKVKSSTSKAAQAQAKALDRSEDKTLGVVEEAQQVATPPVKRGRGRPRKNPIVKA